MVDSVARSVVARVPEFYNLGGCENERVQPPRVDRIRQRKQHVQSPKTPLLSRSGSQLHNGARAIKLPKVALYY